MKSGHWCRNGTTAGPTNEYCPASSTTGSPYGCQVKTSSTAYDLAVQTNGKNLPVTFKFGTDNVPYYKTFDTVADLQDFYVKAMKHIQNALSEGWMKKGALDLALYEVG